METNNIIFTQLISVYLFIYLFGANLSVPLVFYSHLIYTYNLLVMIHLFFLHLYHFSQKSIRLSVSFKQFFSFFFSIYRGVTCFCFSFDNIFVQSENIQSRITKPSLNEKKTVKRAISSYLQLYYDAKKILKM